MSYDALSERSVSLRLDFNVVQAVQRRGLPAVLRVALVAWWNRPRLPADLSPRLRAAMGLPPPPSSAFWPEPVEGPLVLPPWRPGL